MLFRSVPAYVVFSNASLADMAARQPASMEEFLEAIADWKRKEAEADS